MTKPVVHLYTLCWDEADMLGFFFRHYDPWVDRYVVYDDGSTDGSLDILRAHPKVELRSFERTDANSFCLSHQALQDEMWRESRGRANWVVVTAIDEHLHVRGRSMADYLAAQTDATILPALGFDMNHPTMPDDHGLLIERVTRGRPRSAFNKLSIFDPDAVRETGFAAGRHQARPTGDLRLPGRDEVLLWHYKHLGFERNAEREARQAARLGSGDIAGGLGQHYRWSKEKLRSFWDEMERESTDLAVRDVAPVKPLWWEDGEPIARAAATSPARPRSGPTVSVVIKAYNHAPYVRQSIESVLSQSFQDFEIVVTDDASTDDTARVLRSFDDSRIDLVVNKRNLGISGAMNATIARARGRYIAILNSDDYALPDRLASQVAFLERHPAVGAVFGMPRPVGEDSRPARFFNDFLEPLRFADFSRRTWLRKFLLHGNCLCAPTAMIRREAYAVGPYDRRLTNLQDLDMWVRMVLAGHDLHVLADEVTAFRIRDGHANTSAPRRDSLVRSNFEMSRVLGHFRNLDAGDFEEVFGDLCRDTVGRPVHERLARLALTTEHMPQTLFALELLHDSAADDEAFDRLRHLTATTDVLGIDAHSRLIEFDARSRPTPRLVDRVRAWMLSRA